MCPTTGVAGIHNALVRRSATAALIGLLAVSCASPIDLVPCETRWSDVTWIGLGLGDVEITALEETPWGVFAATDSSGVFALDSATGAWESRGLEGRQVTSLVFAGPPDRLLAGVFTPWEGWTPPDTVIFASPDGGRTWTASDSGFPAQDGNDYVMTLLADTTGRSTVFAGGRAGILRSLDAGRTWEVVLSGGGSTTALGYTTVEGGVVLAGHTSALNTPALLRGTAGGLEWNDITPYPGGRGSPSAFAVDPINPSQIWMGSGVVVRSDDAGLTWDSIGSVGPGAVAGLSAEWDALVAVTRGAGVDPFRALVSCQGDPFQYVPPAPVEATIAATITRRAADGSLLIGTAGGGVWRLEAAGQ